MHVITTPSMPKANGHYSQCIAHHGILYLSGQLPIDPISKNIPALFFGDHKPARCIVPVPTLHYGCLIEIEATAVLPDAVGLQSRS